MDKIICMASSKGGSGKTVLTATFATFLYALGKKVLIIDTDASTNGLTLMYLKEVMLQNEHAISESRKPLGTFEVNESNYNPEIVKLPNGVHMIPATYSFINTEDKSLASFTIGLKEVLKLIHENYDYIFLDAQAGSDNYAHVAMRKDISNEVVIVSEYDPLSAAGIERLKALFREDLTYNRTWVLLNKMLPDFVQSFSDFLEVAKYLSPIPWDAEVVKAYARRKLALDLEYGNDFTIAIIQTIKSLLGDAIKKEIEEWTESKAAIIREPIQTQYKDVKFLLDNLYIQASKYDKIKKLNIVIRKLVTTIFVTSFLTTIIYFVEESQFNTPLFYLTVALGTAFLFLELSDIKLFDKSGDLANNKTKNEIKELEDKLLRLNAMRNAEFETLIRNKGNFQSKRRYPSDHLGSNKN